MQATRQQILEILQQHGEATVDEIVRDLQTKRGSITAVTVRHHLTKLQQDGLIEAPQTQHRSAPGRPRHVYRLSHLGAARLPNNYQQLAKNLLQQVEANFGQDQVNVIIEGITDNMAADASIPPGTFHDRLEAVTHYLNEHGYDASWEAQEGGYLLHTSNCPYHQISHENEALCQLDMRLVAKMLGVVPRLMSRISEGGAHCSYFIPEQEAARLVEDGSA